MVKPPSSDSWIRPCQKTDNSLTPITPISSGGVLAVTGIQTGAYTVTASNIAAPGGVLICKVLSPTTSIVSDLFEV